VFLPVRERSERIISIRLRRKKHPICSEAQLLIPRLREAVISMAVERIQLIIKHQLRDHIPASIQPCNAPIQRRQAHERLRRRIRQNLHRVARKVLPPIHRHVHLVLNTARIHMEVIRVRHNLTVVPHIIHNYMGTGRHLPCYPHVKRLLLVIHVQRVAEDDPRRAHNVVIDGINRLRDLDQKDHVVAHSGLQRARRHVDEAVRGGFVADSALLDQRVRVLVPVLDVRGRDWNERGGLVGRERERDETVLVDGDELDGEGRAAVGLYAQLDGGGADAVVGQLGAVLVEEGCDEGAVGGVWEVGVDYGGLDVDFELVQGRLAADGEQLGHGEEEVDDAVELFDEAVEVGKAF